MAFARFCKNRLDRNATMLAVRTWIIGVIATCMALSVEAAEFKRIRLSDGSDVDYALVLPARFRDDKSYPALLAFPGGPQTLESVKGGLSRYWEHEAAKRGYIVFSPAAPPGKPFHGRGADLVPEFLQRQLAAFKIEGGKFHVAGSSNGGVSAFVAAIRYPELFHSLTALAGFPVEDADFSRLDRLKNIKVAMFVGASDQYWKEGMEKTRDRLRALGQPVYFEAIPRNGHFLPDLSFENSARIFERIGRAGFCGVPQGAVARNVAYLDVLTKMPRDGFMPSTANVKSGAPQAGYIRAVRYLGCSESDILAFKTGKEWITSGVRHVSPSS